MARGACQPGWRSVLLVLLGLGCSDGSGPSTPSSPQLVGTWQWIGSIHSGQSYTVSGSATFGPDSMLTWDGVVYYEPGVPPLVDQWAHPYRVRADTLFIDYASSVTKAWVVRGGTSALTLSLAGASPPVQILTLCRGEGCDAY